MAAGQIVVLVRFLAGQTQSTGEVQAIPNLMA